MEQRKLMLPAFHGEKMERLSDLMAEVAEREVASWPRETPIELHPRMQRLTLEIILRAVFGLEPGPRLDALRERLGAMLAFGDRPISLLPIPAGERRRDGPRAGRPVRRSSCALQEEADELIFELIDERRREGDERRRHPRDAARGAPRGRLADVRPGAARRADDAARGRSRDHRVDARLGLRAPGPPARGARAAARGDRRPATTTPTSRRRSRRRCAAGRCCPTPRPGSSMQPIEVGGWSYPTGVCLVPNAYLIHHDPDDLPGSLRVPPGALPRRAARHLHLDPVRRRAAALPRRQLRDARDEDRAPRRAGRVRAAAGGDGHSRSPRRRNITITAGRWRGRPCWRERQPRGRARRAERPSERVRAAAEPSSSRGPAAPEPGRAGSPTASARCVVFVSIGFLIPIFIDRDDLSELALLNAAVIVVGFVVTGLMIRRAVATATSRGRCAGSSRAASRTTASTGAR